MTNAYLTQKSLNQLQLVGAGALTVAAFLGVFLIGDPAELAGYIAILFAAVAPVILWVRHRGIGLPILPIIGLGYFSYYGVAVLSGNTDRYQPDQVLTACLTVAAFLIAATLCWSAFAFRRHSELFERDRELQVDAALPRLMFSALLFGVLFEVGSKGNWWDLLGTWLGTFRSLAMAAMSVGCFLFGTAIGRGRLKPFERVSAYGLVALLMIVEVSELIMHMAIVLMGAVLIGYIISSKRLPLLALVVIVPIVGFLHGAENLERDRYWQPATGERQTIGILQIPDLMVEWVSAGLDHMGTANSDDQNLASRASQLRMLLIAEEQTPRNIDFLNGVTYANFPAMVVPRFLIRDKITSQENLNILSVRYRLQRPEDVDNTTIAWNLVPEAYANFGYPGVVLVGFAFGLVVGLITWATLGAPPISLRGLIGLASLVTLLDMEYDFSYLMVNLFQSIFSISMFYIGMKIVEFFLGRNTLDHSASGFRSV